MLLKEKKALKPADTGLQYLLGGKTLMDTEIKSGFDLIALSNEGIKKGSMDALIGHIGISKKAFAEDVLQISVKTMERKSSDDRLDKRTSSHIIEIAKIMEHAFDVFENEDKVQLWLNTPNRALNHTKPIDLFYIATGLTMVDDILGRIEHGVYS